MWSECSAAARSSVLGDVHIDSGRGFQVEVPAGWTIEERLGGSEVAFTLNLRPPGVESGVAVAVQVSPNESDVPLRELFARDVERIRSGERYSGLVQSEATVAGRTAPTLQVEYRAASIVYTSNAATW